MKPENKLLLFTDVDGCLLNKTDYDYAPAKPVLERLKALGVPVILASSKTAPELSVLSAELSLQPAPLICENGGQIVWPNDEAATIQGMGRDVILTILEELKTDFRFRSFRDLGLSGVMEATDLPEASAARAADRHSTEPLLWDDREERLVEFADLLKTHQLTFTKGGRFWHVAGQVTKGDALQQVVHWYAADLPEISWVTSAVGDSPIDQSMLDIVDYPIGIPAPDGSFHVTIKNWGMMAAHAGAAGWAECVSKLLELIEKTL